MSVYPLQQSFMSLLGQVICAPPAAVSNPINWNSAALSAPTAVTSHGQGFYTVLLCSGMWCCHHHSWGILALPMSYTKCSFSPSSSSLPLGAHGNSDKSAPCHPGWLGESREGKASRSPITPTPLCGTPGQGCATRQAFPTMSSQQGGITFFKRTL